jgi:tetratricopeptide (TPR) repeat protein
MGLERDEQTTDEVSAEPGGEHGTAADSRKRAPLHFLALLALVALVVLAVHWPVLSTEALLIDDGVYLLSNPLVQDPGWNSTSRFLTEVSRPSTIVGYYHPLTMISLMTDYALGGRPDHLMPFRRTSLILHVANTLLVGTLIYLLFRNTAAAVAVALLFGLHPLTVEPVAWLGQRKAILAMFFAMVALVCYVRAARARGGRAGIWLTLCAAAYTLGLMSKPTITPLPVIFVLLDLWPLRRRLFDSRVLLEKVPLFGLALLFGIITVTSHIPTVAVTLPTEFPWWRTPLMVSHKLAFYLGQILWPADLASFYPAPDPLTLANPVVSAGLVVSLLVAAGVLVSLRWTRAIATGTAIFLIALLPVIGIIGHSPIYAWDNYVYFPLIGVLLVAAWALAKAWDAAGGAVTRKPLRAGLLSCLLLLAAAEAVGTRGYLSKWRDTEVHYQYVISQVPNYPILYNELGNHYFREGEYEQALAAFRRAIEVYPDDLNALNDIGTVYQRRGQLTEALDAYQEVLRRDPHHFHANANSGVVLQEQGQYDAAIPHFEAALRAEPQSGDMHYRLNLALEALGRHDEAQQHLQRAMALQPNLVDAEAEQARRLFAAGDFEAALAAFRARAERHPRDASAQYDLGLVLAKQGAIDEAMGHFSRALELDDKHFAARRNLAAALRMRGRIDAAIPHLVAALDLRPGDAAVNNELGRLLATTGQAQKALEHLRAAVRLEPGQPPFLMDLAWLLATHPDPALRDGAEAVRLAEEACSATGYQDPRALDVLAAAYADSGRFAESVQVAQRGQTAAQAAGNAGMKQHFTQRLDLYNAQQPLRTGAAPAAP